MGEPDTTEKEWRMLPPLPQDVRARLEAHYHPVMAQVLYNRGQDTPGKAAMFLGGGEAALYNAFAMHGMQEAVARIRHAIKRGEKIAVYGDFDADGVTSTALLTQALEALGGRVKPYIPHRVDEGYGLNNAALKELKETHGVRLVITVDCGIRSVEEVAYGNALGLDIIVTDHHSVGDELPPALAVIDPKIDVKQRLEGIRANGYPEDMLAGVGVAYKLAEALFKAEERNGSARPNFKLDDLLDLVALGTVADLAPLDRLENRELVRRGLEVLNQARRPGIYELALVAGVEPGRINTTSIGYMLGPRINAAGRLADAMVAYDLLVKSKPEVDDLAQQLQEINIQRQQLTQEAVEIARELAHPAGDGAPLIFAADSRFRPGIVGLVAGRLCEEFYLPAIVIERGKEESRGSCRSIPEFNITEALDQCAGLLVRHGGHAQAAGFTIFNENIDALREEMLALAQQALGGRDDLRPKLDVDAEVSFDDLTMDLANELLRLEPTGAQNNVPLLLTRQLKVVDYKGVGQEGRHLKLKLAGGTRTLDAIAFRQGDWAERMPQYIDAVYNLEINEWNGYIKLQLNIQDLKSSGRVWA